MHCPSLRTCSTAVTGRDLSASHDASDMQEAPRYLLISRATLVGRTLGVRPVAACTAARPAASRARRPARHLQALLAQHVHGRPPHQAPLPRPVEAARARRAPRAAPFRCPGRPPAPAAAGRSLRPAARSHPHLAQAAAAQLVAAVRASEAPLGVGSATRARSPCPVPLAHAALIRGQPMRVHARRPTAALVCPRSLRQIFRPACLQPRQLRGVGRRRARGTAAGVRRGRRPQRGEQRALDGAAVHLDPRGGGRDDHAVPEHVHHQAAQAVALAARGAGPVRAPRRRPRWRRASGAQQQSMTESAAPHSLTWRQANAEPAGCSPC